MKPFIILTFLFILSSPAFSKEQEKINCSKAQITQGNMNRCSNQSAHKTEDKLEKLLTNLKNKYADNPEKLKKIEKAQQAWEAFIEAQLDLLYSDHDGSAMPMCYANEAAYLTRLRTEQIQNWIDNNVEGNVCGGL